MPTSIETSVTNSAPTYAKGVTLVLTAGIFWSFVPLGVRGFATADVWQILFYRSIGILPMVYWLAHRQANWNALTAIRSGGISCVIGGLGLVAAYAGAIASIKMTTIANAAFLFATAPFFAAILARIVLKESIRKSTIVALFLAMTGIFIMVYDSFSHGNWLGDLIALISAVGFAVFAISLRFDKTGNSLHIILLGAVFSVLLALVMSLVNGGGVALPIQEIVLGLSLGAFVLGIGMALCAIGSQIVPAAELALLCMTEIVLAPVWAWLFLSEVPAQSVLLGGTIVVVAIVLNAITGIRHKPVPPTMG